MGPGTGLLDGRTTGGFMRQEREKEDAGFIADNLIYPVDPGLCVTERWL